MDYVAITIASPPRVKQKDLLLPLDVPQYSLVESIMQALDLNISASQRGFLSIREGRKKRALPWQRTLRECGVQFGQFLVLEFRDISARAFLSCVQGPQFDLEKDEMTIGCRSDMDIDLRSIPNQEFVSGRHARIYYQEGAYHLKDLGSLNGTLVNAVRLAPETAQRLDDGDEIVLGATPEKGIRLILKILKSKTPETRR